MSKNLVVALRSVNPRVVLSGLALITISVIAASCSNDVTGPVEAPITPPKEILSTLFCRATPSTRTLSCSETPDALGNVLPSYMLGVGSDGLALQKIIIGGQNTNIKLTSSNIVNNTTTHDFSFDVNVKNLRPQAIGTSNGTTTDSSLAVFFYSGPTTTGGSGSTTVSNPSGVSAFTGPSQPYFLYKEMVAQNATSSNKNWILHYDPTVTSFSFLLLVSANVKYPEGYIDVFPNPGAVTVGGSALQMTDSVRDALGYARADQSETWSLSDSTKASINASGQLTGLANGTVVVTATQGQEFGSATITVSGAVTPTAVVDSSAANSAPGSAYHTALNTQYVLAAPGVLSNDTPGNPAGTVSTFGADSLGGAVTDHAAGSTVSPLPGHADGSLTVAANGAVTFTPPTGFTGYYAFHYRNTNSNGSTSALVRIAVGVRPTAGNSTYAPTVLGNVGINTSTSTNTKVNAAGDGLTYHFVSASNGTGNVHADGTFDFKPNVGYTGAANVVYNVSNGFGTTANGTVSITVASRIWFVADSAGGTGDGRYGSPLKCVVGASNCLSGVTLAANDIVHIAPGTYANTSALTLTSGMKIIGQGASGLFADAANANVTWPADAGAQPGTAGTRPMLNSGGTAVLIGGGTNVIRGLNMGTASQASLSGSTNGGMTVGNAAIINPSGGAVLLTFSGGSVTINLDSAVATGGTNGINLHKQSGTFSSTLTRINNPTGTAITVDSSSGFSFGSTFVRKTSTSGIGVNLLQNSGTTTFSTLVDSTSAGPTMLVTNGGTIAINGGNLNSIGGTAIDASNTAFSGTGFTQVNASSIGGTAVNLSNVTGALAMGNGSITGGSNAAISATSGSTVTLTYSGSVTAGTGKAVIISNGGAAACASATLSGNISSTTNGILVQNCNSGAITFSGASKLLKTTTNKAVQLTSNTGATINFTNGGLVDSTTSGSAFEATGGGTVTVTGAGNILNSTTGTALNVTSTTIGGSGLTFQSISANGGTNGIILSNTGANAGLSVTGNGGACVSTSLTCSGGTIGNTTGSDDGSVTPVGAGIVLNNTRQISLIRMRIHDNSNYGIRGTDVIGFTLDSSVINGTNGNTSTFGDASARFDNLTGSAEVKGTNISGGFYDNFRVENATGTLDRITFDHDTIGANGVGGNDALLIESDAGAGALKATVTNSKFTSAAGDLLNYIHNGTGLGDLVVTGNAFSNNHPAIATGGGGLTLNSSGTGGNTTMTITNNTMRDAVGAGILIFKTTGGSTQTGTFDGNTIGVAAIANSGSLSGDGLKLQTVGQGTMTWSVTNNFIYQYNNFGIDVLAGGSATLQSGTFNTTITGNTISNPGTAVGSEGIAKQGVMLNIGTVPGDTYQVCSKISGNDLSNSGADSNPSTINVDMRVRQRQNTTIRLPGYGGANNDNTAVQNFLIAGNPSGATALASNTVGSGGFGFIGTGTTCP